MLYLVRGIPGSGKSTYARNALNCLILESDMFFIENDEYKFDHKKIKQAHQWCQQTAKHAILSGLDVCVCNTFIHKWEIEPYLNMCKNTNTPFKIIRIGTKHKSIHNVPDDVISRMESQIEDIDGEEIIS